MTDDAATTDPAGVRWLDDREQCAWRAFLEMQARLSARLNRDIQESTGLSMSDFAVLVHLSEHPGDSMRVLELARGVQWEKSRLSHQLTRMEQRGLVERSKCDSDRRGAHIVLTPAGREAVEKAAPLHVASVRRYLFDALTPELVDALDTISRGTVARIEAAGPAGECDSADISGDVAG